MDYPETLVIDVNQEDIDNGKPLNASQCPIANAVARTFGIEHRKVAVTGYLIAIDDSPSNRYRYFPIEERYYRDYIYDFDSDRLVYPTRFTFKKGGAIR